MADARAQATRILERYKVIFKAYPMFLKFVKQLAKEAFWLYQGSINANHPTWALAYKANLTVCLVSLLIAIMLQFRLC